MKRNLSLATQRKALSRIVLCMTAGVILPLSMLTGCGQKGPLTLGQSTSSTTKSKAIEPASAASTPAPGALSNR